MYKMVLLFFILKQTWEMFHTRVVDKCIKLNIQTSCLLNNKRCIKIELKTCISFGGAGGRNRLHKVCLLKVLGITGSRLRSSVNVWPSIIQLCWQDLQGIMKLVKLAKLFLLRWFILLYWFRVQFSSMA